MPSQAARARHPPVAVIDIGSNSGRVVVYGAESGGQLRILAASRAPLQLVRELPQTGRLGGAAIERAVEALRDFRAIAVGAGAAHLRVIATAAVREAADGERLIGRLRDELGLEVLVVEARLEAEYGFLGAVRGLPVGRGWMFDLGGGSLQVSRFAGRKVQEAKSFPLGALRLSRQWLSADPPSKPELRRLRDHVRETLASGLGPLEGGERLIGTGGSVRNLAKLDRRERGYPIARIHGYVLTRGRVRDLAARLGAKRLGNRGLPGLSRDRGDSIVGGAFVVLGLMERLEARELTVSGQGVREGLAYQVMCGCQDLQPVSEVRAGSVRGLAERFATWDPAMAERRAAIAESLSAGIDPGGPPDAQEALLRAARLLDIGRAVDFFDRHEHAADVVLETDLAGFDHREIALTSAIIRYAGDDAVDIQRYAPVLRAADAVALERAGILLAIADDIEERCPDQTPIGLTCRIRGRAVRVQVPALLGFRPRAVLSRFERVFGRRLEVEAGSRRA
jgi:exopolyphosphatase / guanosine-5'-triphosphate,3'-diphosphate pyrophosphatase